MRENCTYGSMRGSRRKTAKSVLRVAEGRAGVSHGASRSTLHPQSPSFIKARGVTTSVCHRTYIYQDGKLIYTNKEN